MDLHARNAPEVRGNKEHGHDPVLVAQLRSLHDSACLGAESWTPASLLPAAKRHGRMLAARLDMQRPALGAANAIWPAIADEPRLGLRVSRIGLDELNESDALAIVLARSLSCQDSILQESAHQVKSFEA